MSLFTPIECSPQGQCAVLVGASQLVKGASRLSCYVVEVEKDIAVFPDVLVDLDGSIEVWVLISVRVFTAVDKHR